MHRFSVPHKRRRNAICNSAVIYWCYFDAEFSVRVEKHRKFSKYFVGFSFCLLDELRQAFPTAHKIRRVFLCLLVQYLFCLGGILSPVRLKISAFYILLFHASIGLSLSLNIRVPAQCFVHSTAQRPLISFSCASAPQKGQGLRFVVSFFISSPSSSSSVQSCG